MASGQEIISHRAPALAQGLFVQGINVFKGFANALQMATPGVARRTYTQRSETQQFLSVWRHFTIGWLRVMQAFL
ncbi:hypothetical protein GCM10009091_42230 [Pseudomonas brenneri]|nr:hypothetical protein GCM10009091_42230 [Pseudomonas brenneri]